MIITRHKEVTFVAMALTSIWYLFAVSWSLNSHLIGAVKSYLLATAIALVPYSLYLWLLNRYNNLYIIKWICLLIIITVQISLFVSAILSHEPGGWEYIIIPFMQTGVVLISMVVLAFFEAINTHDE